MKSIPNEPRTHGPIFKTSLSIQYNLLFLPPINEIMMVKTCGNEWKPFAINYLIWQLFEMAAILSGFQKRTWHF